MTVILKVRHTDAGSNLYIEGVKCDRCLTIHKPRAKSSALWGQELRDNGWVARKRNGRYRHACPKCKTQFLIDHDHGIRLF